MEWVLIFPDSGFGFVSDQRGQPLTVDKLGERRTSNVQRRTLKLRGLAGGRVAGRVKSEYRISKLEGNSKSEKGEKFETAVEWVSIFPDSSFGFVSDFGIRDSDFEQESSCKSGSSCVQPIMLSEQPVKVWS